MNAAALLFIARSAGETILLAGIAYASGRRVTHLLKLRFASFPEDFSCSAATGCGVIGLLAFLLGVIGILRPAILATGIAVLIASGFPLFRGRRSPFGTLGGVPAHIIAAAAAAALLLMPLLLLPLYPPTASDAVTYHLAAARLYARSGNIAPTPELRYVVFPQLAESLFSSALLLGNDILAQCISLLFLAITACAISGFLHRMAAPGSSAWGAGLFLSSSVVLILGSVAYADMALTAFVTVAIIAFERWCSDHEPGWLALAGLMLGFAAGTKYSALFFPVLFAIIVLVNSGRCDRPGPGSRVRALATLMIPLFAAAFPWYAYNTYHTGNPVWPFFPEFFGTAYWNRADVAGQMNDLFLSHGTGTGPAALLTLPWNLFVHPELFHTDGTLSNLLGLSLPMGLYAIARERWARRLAVVALAYTLFWFFTAQILRYLVPILPTACILACGGAASAFDRYIVRPLKGNPQAMVFIGVLLLFPASLIALRTVHLNGVPPSTAEARDRFLEQHLRPYAAIRFINSAAGSSYTLYAYHAPTIAYYTNGRFRGDFFGPWRYDRIPDMQAENEGALLHALNGIGADYFLDRDDISGSSCNEQWLRRRFVVLVFRSPGVSVFAVSRIAQHPEYGPDLAGRLPGAPDTLVRDGIRIGVRQGAMYYCACSGTAGPGVAGAALQIRWLRGDGTTIRIDEASGIFTPAGDVLRILSTCPDHAESALLTLTPVTGPLPFVQSLSFSTIRFVPVSS